MEGGKLFVFLRAFGASWQPLWNQHAPQGILDGKGSRARSFTKSRNAVKNQEMG